MFGRLFGIATLALVTASCSSLSSRSDVAAEVGEHELTAERVASVLAKQTGGANLQMAAFVSNLWLDYSMFAEALATNKLPTDSATVARVMWPEISQARAQMWRDSLQRQAVAASPNAADSVYQAGDYKAFQHIITMVKGATKADTAKAERTIRQALARVKGGADFGAVAKEVSEDGSKDDDGHLGVKGRGGLVPAFEDPAWKLEPGQVSDVVQSEYGYHIIRRPTLEEVRGRFDSFVRDMAAQKNDSAFTMNLIEQNRLKVSDGAPAAIRNAAAEPAKAASSSQTVVAIEGDDLTAKDLVRWMGMLPIPQRLGLQNAPDSALRQIAMTLGQLTVLVRGADSAKFYLPAPQWQFVQLKYTTEINNMRRDLGLEIPELSDSSKLAQPERSRLAAEKVEDYFTKLLDNQVQMRFLYPPLAADLRMERFGRVNQAGVSRAVELAQAETRRDSAAGRGAGTGAPPSGVKKAAGGPPISDSSK